MSPHLDESLCTKYPLIFANRHASMMETLMCWGFDCGDGWYDIIDTMCNLIQNHIDGNNNYRQYCIERNNIVEAYKSGNKELYDELVKNHFSCKDFSEDYIQKHIESWVKLPPAVVPEEVNQVNAVQVKEKFGRLNFYYDYGDEYIRGVVRMSEAMSCVTCMECGKPGQMVTKGWWHVACDEHWKDEL